MIIPRHVILGKVGADPHRCGRLLVAKAADGRCVMGRRAGGHIRLVLMGLLPGLGCATGSGTAPPGPPAPLAPQLSSSARLKSSNLSPAAAADLCATLARKLESEGQDAEAIKQYQLARHYRPSFDVAHRLAVLYDRVGDAGRAVPEYARALKEHPRDADLLNDLGYHHYNLGRWDEAEKYLRQAVALNPKLDCAWTNLGMTLVQEGHCKEGVEAFRHCVSPADAECNLAFLLTTQGKTDDARAAYREALRLQPGLQSAQAALAKLDEPARHPVAVAEEGTGQRTRPGPPELRAAAVTAVTAKKDKDAHEPAAGARAAESHKVDGGAAETVRTAAADTPPAPAARATVAGKGSGWVIPGAPGGGAGNPDAAQAAVADAPAPSNPACVGGPVGPFEPVVGRPTEGMPPNPACIAAPADPPSSGESAGAGLRWLPPPPVPHPHLPADLVPITRPPAPAPR
jgi:Tfp pilus assembly protein PilF